MRGHTHACPLFRYASLAKHAAAQALPSVRVSLTGPFRPAETVCMAAELKKESITIISQNPGWVQTDMGSYTSNKMGGKVKPPLDAPTSISKQLALFAKLTPGDTGKFYDVTGDVVPW